MVNDVDIFNLYRKKTVNLVESRFSKSLSGSGIKISAVKGQPVKVERPGPDFEAIGFIATIYRNFSLNDLISIKNIAKIYDKLPEGDPLRKEFSKIRTALNNFLESDTTINVNGEQLTRKLLIDRYLYGEIIHLNKYEEFERWIDSSPLKELIYN